MATQESHTLSPVYIPWKTLENYIANLKSETTVPHTLDNSVRPKKMSGGLWRQLLSALRFLGLTKDGNVVSDGLEAMVDAYGEDSWAQAVKEHVLPAYDEIVGDLPIDRATAAQLAKRFRENGDVDGQMLRKAVRFYVSALRVSGASISSHLATVREATTRPSMAQPKRKPKARRESPEKDGERHGAENGRSTPPDAIDFPIPIGDTNAYFMRVPRTIVVAQLPMVEAMYNAVKVLANQNSQNEEK
ncbi:MAG: hypothetical protein HYS13_20100 [Planctomycetia bacterium]|nr:hypothetical protein [Planctomycetia bacterium]